MVWLLFKIGMSGSNGSNFFVKELYMPFIVCLLRFRESELTFQPHQKVVISIYRTNTC
ncbi:hypothetical protein SAMN05192588_2361 [Nonlabens sp. Hel1_33_55]|nr:hypothetical protein SAMN05192588_2361 [Nonlabens sp. Hel1_33_55]